MEVAFAYNQHTTLTTTLNESALDFATNLHRPPVAFQGRVKEPLLLRNLMVALHEVILSDMRRTQDMLRDMRSLMDVGRRKRLLWLLLDPVITVHHDQLFFEAFSNDESSYARVSAPFDVFEPAGVVNYGTTNIDFTHTLRDALLDMRSSRRTLFTVGAGGFGVSTNNGGGTVPSHFERKVDLPESWLRGFLQVQGAMTMRPWFLEVRPVDLLTIIAYLQEHKARSSPRAIRYELVPDEPVQVVLEPWEERFTLKGTHYQGYARTVRLWGRSRLSLLQHVLPYADRVTIAILGRGMPHFYICHCGRYQFTLALSNWVNNEWSGGSTFDLLAPMGAPDAEQVAMVYACLQQHLVATLEHVVDDTGLPATVVETALFQLCRGGRVMYDLATRAYRLRELFATPLDVNNLFQPDPRLATAHRLVAQGKVRVDAVTQTQATDVRRQETHANGCVEDETATHEVMVAVDASGRLRFGRCTCPFFQEHLMARGPCEHILALRFVLEGKQER